MLNKILLIVAIIFIHYLPLYLARCLHLDAAFNLFNKSGTIFSLSTNNGLLSFLFEVQSTPQVIDHILDSQRIVDNKIKNLCELFIDHSVRLILKRLQLVRNQLVNCSKIINNETTTTTLSSSSADESAAKVPVVESARNASGIQIETIDSSSIGSEECNRLDEQRQIKNEAKSTSELQLNEPKLANDDTATKSEQISTNHQSLDQQSTGEQSTNQHIVNQHTTDQHFNEQSTTNQCEDEQSKESKEKCCLAVVEQNEQLDSVQQLVKDLNELISEANEQVIAVQKSMKIYLSSEDTEAILFKPIKNHIVKSIEALFNQLSLVFSDQEQKLYIECQFTTAKSALESIFKYK